MPNIGQVLKDEIARISRRETKKGTAALQRSSATYRKQIAALKRHITRLEREIRDIEKGARGTSVTKGEAAESGSRFSAKGLRSLRNRLELSASQLAKLLGVSEQAIYNWETKKASPRPQYLSSIVQLRAIGKRQAAGLLKEAESAPKKVTKRQAISDHRKPAR